MLMRRAISCSILTIAALAASACASAQPRMWRALDPSMERVLRTETYLSTVSGISANPAKIMRGDGYVYMADLAPQLRFLANTADTTRYRALRAFLSDKMMRHNGAALAPMRRYRSGAVFEPATQYGVIWLNTALRDGWKLLGDTASAMMLAQVRMVEAPPPPNATRVYNLTVACGEAMDVVQTSLVAARDVVSRAKTLLADPTVETEQAKAGVTVVEGEADLLSCLTRVGLALQDPDVTVTYLDHLLTHLTPLMVHSGRPDLGTTADILLTLHRVREAGPRYFDPPNLRVRPLGPR
jgi:hypothetical protein